MDNKKVVFSIIIPHHNIPSLLVRCLKSIPSSEDIQVIVIDDNSSESDTYLDKYPELSRPNVVFIRSYKLGGAGFSRNIGLERAIGEWILFADADDFFVPNMYEIIRANAETDADVVYYKKKSVLSDDVKKESHRSDYVNYQIDGYIKTGDDVLLRTMNGVPWGKMIRRSLIERHHIRFHEVMFSNDIFFSACVGLYAQKITAVDKQLYVVTTRAGSLTNQNVIDKDELSIRAHECFEVQKLFYQSGMRLVRWPFRSIFLRLLDHNKSMFNYYLKRIGEIYPSTFFALQDISNGHTLLFRLKLYIYCLLVLYTPYGR